MLQRSNAKQLVLSRGNAKQLVLSRSNTKQLVLSRGNTKKGERTEWHNYDKISQQCLV